MTGISFEVTIDSAEIDAELARRLRQMQDLTPFHRLVGEHMMVSLDERFQTETAPDGAPVVYAAIHHFGGKAGRGRKVTIPARPTLGLSADDQTAVAEIAGDWLSD